MMAILVKVVSSPWCVVIAWQSLGSHRLTTTRHTLSSQWKRLDSQQLNFLFQIMMILLLMLTLLLLMSAVVVASLVSSDSSCVPLSLPYSLPIPASSSSLTPYLKVLNIATAGMESLLIDIGSCSGSTHDKFVKFGLKTSAPGQQAIITSGNSSLKDLALGPFLAIDHPGIAAHLSCCVEEVHDRHDHYVLFCRIEEVHVQPCYWKNGKNLVAPLLSFLGSKQFAHTITETTTASI